MRNNVESKPRLHFKRNSKHSHTLTFQIDTDLSYTWLCAHNIFILDNVRIVLSFERHLPFYLFTSYAERFFLPVCFYRTHNTTIAVHSHFTFHIRKIEMEWHTQSQNLMRYGSAMASSVMVLSSHISAAKNNVNRTIDRERKTEKETKSSKRI